MTCWKVLWLLACLAGIVAPALAAEPADSDSVVRRQLLVMLRVPAAHYRPDASYGNDYGQPPGRLARRRVAGELARAHGLTLRDEWPMPALGVDCFVLDAADAA